MEYWEGQMNWPLDKDWVCLTCGQNGGLEWGIVHAQCRCYICHTEYSMRADDEKRTILTTPKCRLKNEYREPIKKAYAKYQVTINEMTDNMINEFKESGDKD